MFNRYGTTFHHDMYPRDRHKCLQIYMKKICQNLPPPPPPPPTTLYTLLLLCIPPLINQNQIPESHTSTFAQDFSNWSWDITTTGYPGTFTRTIFWPWGSCQIHKMAGCTCAGNAVNAFLATDFKGNNSLAIPACIAACAWRTCPDACRDS